LIFRILSDTFAFFLTGLVAPIQLIVVTGLLIKEIYAYALIPLGVFVLSLPVSGIISSRFGGLRAKQQMASDNRLKLVRELISAIRIVKYYAWEIPFERNIDKFREAEIDRVKSTALTRATAVGVFSAVGPIGTGMPLLLSDVVLSLALTSIGFSLQRWYLLSTRLSIQTSKWLQFSQH
jgi:hypothetical protein